MQSQTSELKQLSLASREAHLHIVCTLAAAEGKLCRKTNYSDKGKWKAGNVYNNYVSRLESIILKYCKFFHAIAIMFIS